MTVYGGDALTPVLREMQKVFAETKGTGGPQARLDDRWRAAYEVARRNGQKCHQHTATKFMACQKCGGGL